MSRRTVFLPLIALAALAACAGPTDPSPTPTVPPTAAPTLTRTATPTPTETLNPLPTRTPMLPTPDFLNSPVAQNGFLLSSSDDPDCQLPCWQGLRVGESDQADVQRMFEEIFYFDPVWDVFGNQAIVESASLSAQLDLPDMRVGGYDWSVSRMGQSPASFDIFAAVDQQTDILQGMRFTYHTGIDLGTNAEGYGKVTPGTELYQPHTVGQTLRVLGSPDAIYVDTRGGFEIMLVYEKGIGSSSFTIEPPRDAVVKGVAGTYEEFCLDGPLLAKNDFIIAPVDLEQTDDLPVLQERWIMNLIRAFGLTPLENLGWVITKDEIVEAAMTQDNPCLLFGPIE